MFKSILLATDGSEHAKRAARIAAGLAAAHDASLSIVSVSSLSLTLMEVEASPQYRDFPDTVKEEMRRLHDLMTKAPFADEKPFSNVPAPQSALAALADGIIDEASAMAEAEGVKKIERAALTGNPAEEILGQAKKSHADLIVMGTRGLSDIGGVFLGSVSHKIMHLADCPCLTVK